MLTGRSRAGGRVECTVTHHIGTTRFDAGISVRASAPGTYEVVAAWNMGRAAEDSNTTADDLPDYPWEAALRRSALDKVGVELARRLLPWTEEVKLTFYDAEECGMATISTRFVAGDLESATSAVIRGGDSAPILAPSHCSCLILVGKISALDNNNGI